MSDAAALWRVPALDAPPPPKPPSIDELQRIEDAARKEGFEAGRREGFKAGEAEVRKLVAQIEGVVEAMARPLGRLDDDVHAALGQMAVRIAGASLMPSPRKPTVRPRALSARITRRFSTRTSRTVTVAVTVSPMRTGALNFRVWPR